MSLGTELLTRALFDLRQRGKMQWLARRNKAMDYYRGDVLEYTQSKFAADKRDKITFSNNNFTKRIIDRISLVYSEPALRDVDNAKYFQVTKNKNKDLLHAERMTNLLNLILLKISWRDGKFDYDIVRDFEVEMHPVIKNKIIRVSFPLATCSAVLGGNGEDVWQQWEEDEIITFNNATKKVLHTEQNVFGVMPFVVVKTTEGLFSFTDIEPSTDLYSMNEAVNVATANMWYNIHLRSFGILYSIGGPEDEEGNALPIEIGPDTMLSLPGGDSGEVTIGMLDGKDSVESITKGITAQYRMVAANYHLTTAFVEGNESATSGTALRIRNSELVDFRKESVVLWRDVEDKIYEIERVILKTFNIATLPEEFSVDFQEKAVILNQSEAESQNNWDLEMGVTTVAQIYQRRNPDLFETLEEYQEQIDENKKTNAGSEAVSLNDVLQS